MSFESTAARGVTDRSGEAPPSGRPVLRTEAAADDDKVSPGASLSDVVRQGLSVLDPHLGVVAAVLVVADPRRRTLSVEAAVGLSEHDLRLRPGLGVAGRVVESGRPIVVPFVRQEPMASAELAELGGCPTPELGLVSLPVVADRDRHRRCLGALSVYFAGDCSTGLAGRMRSLEGLASAVARRLEDARSPTLSDGRREPKAGVVFDYANMIGATAPMRQVYEEIGQVAPTTATVLILGESGTGKELVAQAIHANSARASRPFIEINGAAFPETLFESELFGHERGAFTGAVGRKRGRLDLAQGGTFFLDEIGELPLSTQVKLLRVLQSREYERLGGTETLRADVRLIAATNKNMTAAIANGSFREDLFYRLNVFTIGLPSLRDRRADVPALSDYFLEKYAVQHRRDARRIASGALDVLCQYHWPGNVRELENAIERAVVVCEGVLVEDRHLPEAIRAAGRAGSSASSVGRPAGKLSLSDAVEQLERQLIEDALRESSGNLARASRALGVTERIVRYKVKKYRLLSSRGATGPKA